jgi:hypothetical protein
MREEGKEIREKEDILLGVRGTGIPIQTLNNIIHNSAQLLDNTYKMN